MCGAFVPALTVSGSVTSRQGRGAQGCSGGASATRTGGPHPGWKTAPCDCPCQRGPFAPSLNRSPGQLYLEGAKERE